MALGQPVCAECAAGSGDTRNDIVMTGDTVLSIVSINCNARLGWP